MDLLLRVGARLEVQGGASGPGANHAGQHKTQDLLVSVEADQTVHALTAGLAKYLGLEHYLPLALMREDIGELLSPDATVERCGLLSGEYLILAQETSKSSDVARLIRGLRLAVTGGPSNGFARVLGPGTYTVGSNKKPDASHVHVQDSTVGTDQLALEIALDLTVRVRERESPTNHATLNGALSPTTFSVSAGDVLRVGTTTFTFRPVERPIAAKRDPLGQVPFHRTPRRPRYPEEFKLAALGEIPSQPDRIRFSYITIAIPLIGGLVLAGVLGEPRFLIFTALAPLSAVASYFDGRKERRRRYEDAIKRFDLRLDARKSAIHRALESERKRRFWSAPDTADLALRAELRQKELWNRTRDHLDFLNLRVGVGDVTPLVVIEKDSGGEDALRDQVAAANAKAEILPEVPITVSALELGVVGIHGNPAAASNLVHSMMLQAVCLHSPEDLIVTAASGTRLALTNWLKWTPHTRSTGSPIAGGHLAKDKQSADQLLRRILEVAEFRATSGDHGIDRRWPWILLALDRSLEPDAALVSQLLDHCPSAGISVIWISDTAERVPPQARVIIDCQPSKAGRKSHLWFTDPDQPDHLLDLDGVHEQVPESIGRALAPLRDASASHKTAAIPRIAPLLATLGVESFSSVWIKEQWAKDRGYAVETTVGLTAEDPLKLDLVEHGPHALIGGTSGSGKSELLQSLVAGLVANHSPRDVTLLFIDFKGGSASEVFKDLPHIVGRVTDLDEALALRAQSSIRAELRRRVASFAERGIKDLRDMRKHHPNEAPPSLVIIIDEFATLVKELPDFVAGIIDIAQRGRSYGIHLVLATQRPSAAVDDNILANTNLRISLRMLDSAESNSVIGSPEAAEIPVPLKGRALARLGPGKLIEFQSAYTGMPLDVRVGPAPVHIAPFDGLEPKILMEGESEDGRATQLSSLLAAILQLGEAPARKIWNPLLPPSLNLSDVRAERPSEDATRSASRRIFAGTTPAPGSWFEAYGPRTAGRCVVIGKLDDPSQQVQYPAVVDLESGGGLLVFGGGGSGKTTLLRTLAVSAALDDAKQTGKGLALFVLDFASGALRDLEALPQCAGVATSADLEATTRILATLDNELRRRRGMGRPLDPTEIPSWQRVLVLVDGYTALVESLAGSPGTQEQTSEEWLEAFQRIVIDGRQVGIHVAISANRAASVRSSLMASVTGRVVLRQADDGETRELGTPSTRMMAPGGGYFGGLRLQVASLFRAEGSSATATIAAGLIGEVSTPVSTTRLSVDMVVPRKEPSEYRGVLGLADLTLDPVEFNLQHTDLFVYGPPQSGRSTALMTISQELLEAGHDVYAVGPEDSNLRHLRGARSAWGREGVAPLLADLVGKLSLKRSQRRCILVFDDIDLMDEPDFYPFFAEFLLPTSNLRIVGSATTTSNLYSNRLIQELPKRSRQILFLQPSNSREVAEFVGLPRLPFLRLGLDMPPGRGLFVANRQSRVVQVSNGLKAQTIRQGT